MQIFSLEDCGPNAATKSIHWGTVQAETAEEEWIFDKKIYQGGFQEVHNIPENALAIKVAATAPPGSLNYRPIVLGHR